MNKFFQFNKFFDNAKEYFQKKAYAIALDNFGGNIFSENEKKRVF